jgi:hypothetical protein
VGEQRPESDSSSRPPSSWPIDPPRFEAKGLPVHLRPGGSERYVALSSTGHYPGSRLEPDLVINDLTQALLAAQVSLCRFHVDVAKQKLDLVEFAA